MVTQTKEVVGRLSDERWLESGYIPKVDPTGFHGGLDTGYERKRRNQV